MECNSSNECVTRTGATQWRVGETSAATECLDASSTSRDGGIPAVELWRFRRPIFSTTEANVQQ